MQNMIGIQLNNYIREILFIHKGNICWLWKSTFSRFSSINSNFSYFFRSFMKKEARTKIKYMKATSYWKILCTFLRDFICLIHATNRSFQVTLSLKSFKNKFKVNSLEDGIESHLHNFHFDNDISCFFLFYRKWVSKR